MFITLKNNKDALILLNINHIISVKPIIITSYKINESDKILTEITSIGALTSSIVVKESVTDIKKLIKASKL